jgi:hypothetical protein
MTMKTTKSRINETSMRRTIVMSEASDFLQRLRASGPWVLTAIIPDGTTLTETVKSDAQIDAFVRKHNGTRNIYYSVNPTRTKMDSKASKTDIAAVEFVHADLDPTKEETTEQAKARYLEQLNGTLATKPTVIVDSGNGIQGLWRIEKPIELNEGSEQTIAEIEKRILAVTLRLGGTSGTQNIDRILRLPGTINWPNEKKRKEGRTRCEAKLLSFTDDAYPLDAFSLPESTGAGTSADSGKRAKRKDDDSNEDELQRTIADGGGTRHGSTKSHAVWWVVNEMLRRGYGAQAILKVLLDRNNKISKHIYEQANPERYAVEQVKSAKAKIDFSRNDNGAPFKTQTNIRICLVKMGVSLRYDQFTDQITISGLPDFGPILDDAAMDRIWLLMDHRYRLKVSKALCHTVILDTARLNGFHPVRDFLDALRWDGNNRIDSWLTIYGGAKDDEYTKAVGALLLVAAVRRVRQPGCKFDEMVVIENEEQGTNKSSALATLAVSEAWFSDDLPLNIGGQQVIECLRGRWIVEAAELSGMRRADVEHLKGFLSRRIDRARPAYGRLVAEVPRQCVIVGTTNSQEYLRDTSGNRRFWPVRIKEFDIAALRQDRDQLWAEAAAREATGVSIRLDKKLWPKAAEEQEQRLTRDPWFDDLQAALGNFEHGKISMQAIWTILDVRGAQRTQEASRRVGEAMRKLKWRRANTGGTVKIDGKLVSGFVCGDHSKEKPWPMIDAQRDEFGNLCVSYGSEGIM